MQAREGHGMTAAAGSAPQALRAQTRPAGVVKADTSHMQDKLVPQKLQMLAITLLLMLPFR
jgi:hypothetical protein